MGAAYMAAKNNPTLNSTLQKFQILVEDVKNYCRGNSLNLNSNEFIDQVVDLIEKYINNNLSTHECYFLCSLYVDLDKDALAIEQHVNIIDTLSTMIFERIVILGDDFAIDKL